MKQACSDTGTPFKPDKCEGPATVLGFLGLELDTEKLEIQLAQDKLYGLLEALSSWRGKESLQEEGVALPHRLTVSRLQSSQIGKDLSEEAYRPFISSQAP